MVKLIGIDINIGNIIIITMSVWVFLILWSRNVRVVSRSGIRAG